MVTAATVHSKTRALLARHVSDLPAVDVAGAWAAYRWAGCAPLPAGGTPETRRARFTITAGTVELTFNDPARKARAEERSRSRADHDDLVRQVEEDDDAASATSRTITAWSPKSRANMLRIVAGLDLTPLSHSPEGWTVGMWTGTLPGEWESVAPTGKHFKAAISRFRLRFLRAYGRPIIGVWKLEFQRRGAPHVHFLMPIPALGPAGTDHDTFEAWASEAWALSVGHKDPEHFRRHVLAGSAVDFSKSPWMDSAVSLARYFLKHSSKTSDDKEYQHTVPEAWSAPGAGPGRFWGVWGLESTAMAVELDAGQAYRVKRVLRRWDRAASRFHGRPARRSLSMASMSGGWVLVRDPDTFARMVGEAAGILPATARTHVGPPARRRVT